MPNDASFTKYLLRDINNGGMWRGCCNLPQQYFAHFQNADQVLWVANFTIGEQRMVPTNQEYFYPKCDPKTTRFQGDLSNPTVYVKSQRDLLQNLDQGDKDRSFRFVTRQLLETEIAVCEAIRSKAPHAHLAEYKGVVVDKWDRATAIVYKRYTSDLYDFMATGRLRDAHCKPILDAVEQGLKHLHSLGFVHGDLRPCNIFLTITGGAAENLPVKLKDIVLGDFDATLQQGARGFKTNGEGWYTQSWAKGNKTASQFEDLYALQQLILWLVRYSVL
jgi:serine/threonine protein kinase